MIQYRFALHTLLCLWLAAVGNSVFAQDSGELSKQDAAGDSISVQLPSADQTSPAAKFVVTVAPKSAKPGEEITVTVKATIAKGWHVNAVELPKDAMGLATTIQVTGKGLEALGDGYVASSKPEEFSQAGLQYFCHSGRVTWSRKFRLGETDATQLTGSVQFQACNDETCLQPNTLKFHFGTTRKPTTPSVKVEPAYAPLGESIRVELKSCDVVRPTAKVSLLGVLFGSGKEKVSLTGTFSHEGVEYSIYLPPDRRYRLVSTSGDTRVESNATYISVDHDRNGVLEEWESVSAHLPFRVADSMIQITEIDKDNMRLTLQQVDAPLSGSIVGRKVAPFSVKTIDGAGNYRQDNSR